MQRRHLAAGGEIGGRGRRRSPSVSSRLDSRRARQDVAQVSRVAAEVAAERKPPHGEFVGGGDVLASAGPRVRSRLSASSVTVRVLPGSSFTASAKCLLARSRSTGARLRPICTCSHALVGLSGIRRSSRAIASARRPPRRSRMIWASTRSFCGPTVRDTALQRGQRIGVAAELVEDSGDPRHVLACSGIELLRHFQPRQRAYRVLPGRDSRMRAGAGIRPSAAPCGSAA